MTNSSVDSIRRNYFKRTIILFFACLLIRTVYVFLSSQGIGEIQSDALEFHTYATNLISKGQYVNEDGEKAARMPGYPLFLAFIFLTAGKSVAAVQAAQVVLSALTAVLLILCAKRLVPEPWPTVTGMIALAYFDLFVGTPRILTETLYVFFMVLFISLWLHREKRIPTFHFIMGCVLGYAYWIRPEALSVILLAAFFLVIEAFPRNFFRMVLFIVGVSLFIGGWAYRNHRELNSYVTTTTRAGLGAYIGLMFKNTPPDKWKGIQFNPLSRDEVENNRLYRQKAKDFYKTIPKKKLTQILTSNAMVLIYPFRPVYDWTLVTLFPFWIVGILFVIKNKKYKARSLLIFLAALSGIYISFGGTVARYRIPLSPFLILLGTIGAYEISQKIGRPLFIKLVTGWVGIQLIIWIFGANIRPIILQLQSHLNS